MECLSDKRFLEKLQCVATLIHFSVNKLPAGWRSSANRPSEGIEMARPMSRRRKKRDCSNLTTIGLNNPTGNSLIDQSNLWTIGQLMEKPALPNGAPPGPVNRPSWTKVNI